MAEIKVNVLQSVSSDVKSTKPCENTEFTTSAISAGSNSSGSQFPSTDKFQMYESNQFLNDKTAFLNPTYPVIHTQQNEITFSSHVSNYEQYYYNPSNIGIDFRSNACGIVRNTIGNIPYQTDVRLHDYQLLKSTRFYSEYDQNGINERTDSTSFLPINTTQNINVHEEKNSTLDGAYTPGNIVFNQEQPISSQFDLNSQAGLHMNIPLATCNVESKYEEQIQIDKDPSQSNASNSNCKNLQHCSYPSQIKEEPITDILDLDSHKLVYPLSLPITEANQTSDCNGSKDSINMLPVQKSASVLWINDRKKSGITQQQENIPNSMREKMSDCKTENIQSFSSSIASEDVYFGIGNNLNEINNRLGANIQQYELPRTSLQDSSTCVKAGVWKSNEARRPKTYNCSACNKWFTSSGHLKRHYNTTLHKNAVKSSGQPDPATLPISSHHHPHKDLGTKNTNGDQSFDVFNDNHPNGQAGSSSQTPEQRGLLKTSSQLNSEMDQREQEFFYKNQNQNSEKRPVKILTNPNHYKKMDIQQKFHNQNPLKNFHSTSNQFLENPVSFHMICSQYQDPIPQQNFQHLSTQHDVLCNTSPTNIHNILKQQHQYIDNPLAININTTSMETTRTQSNILIKPVYHPSKILNQANFRTISGKNQAKISSTSRVLDGFSTLLEKDETGMICTTLNSNKNIEEISPTIPNKVNFVKHAQSEYFNENILKMKPPTSVLFLEGPNKFIPQCQQSPQEADVPSQNLKLSAKLPEPTTMRQLNRYSDVLVSNSEKIQLNALSKNEVPKIKNRSSAPKKNSSDVIKCEECNKMFAKICYLTQHNKSFHSGEQPYRCQQCGKRFHSEDIYVAHLNKHKSHDKPFKCDLCPKQFHHKTDLRRHVEAIHTGNKAHACNQCNKRFCRKDHLRKHCDTHTRIKDLRKINKVHLNTKLNTQIEKKLDNNLEEIYIKKEMV